MALKPPLGRSIGSLLPQITKKAMESYGFPAAAVLTDWSQIVGPEVAAFTQPERLRWPRRAEAADEPSLDGATLVVRVEGPRALELQHCIPQLIDRINSHFGFLAVTDIRILQAPIATSPKPAERPRLDPKSRITIAASEVPNERLRDVLERLGAQVRAKRGD